MPKVQRRQLKDQFTVRIYNQENSDILKTAFKRFEAGFDTISDFIRHCVILGSEKLLNDSKVDQRINLDEIKTTLYSINEKLESILKRTDFRFKEQQAENNLTQDLINYIAKIVYMSDVNNDIGNTNIENGFFNLNNERLKALKKVFNE